MIVKGELKKYLGAIVSEQQAARFYDKYLIIIKGKEAKTNFSYTRDQAIQLLETRDDMRDENALEAEDYSRYSQMMSQTASFGAYQRSLNMMTDM